MSSLSSLKEALKEAEVNLYDEEANPVGEINITLHNADQRSFPGAISIYPNPFKDALTIEFDRTEKSTGKIELLDIRGRKMWSEDYSARKGMRTFQMLISIQIIFLLIFQLKKVELFL